LGDLGNVWRVAAIGIGSNVGDRVSHLAFARSRLEHLLREPRFSPAIETEPEDVSTPQGPFLNAAAVGETDLSAPALVSALLAIEGERGRERPFAGAPRTLDLDLILLGDCVVDEPGVIVPHPRFRQRRFVLAPLVQIAPALVDPVSGRTIEQLLRALPR
jgi:2-amino-4-hydroxy-6-hydroxymethyldihydropteridine diphosphokinase